MDERYDCVRSVRNQRYVYIRNYMPHKIYGQHLDYMWETPTTRVWERLYKEGKLNAAQRKFWETKPPEELYHLASDRDEIDNLASSPSHHAALVELRAAHREHALKIRDIGLLPEAELHTRPGDGTPYETGHDPKAYPMERVLDIAEVASSLKPGVAARLIEAMADPDSGVRYWGAIGGVDARRKRVEVHACGGGKSAGRQFAQRSHRGRRGSGTVRYSGRTGPRPGCVDRARQPGRQRDLSGGTGAERH